MIQIFCKANCKQLRFLQCLFLCFEAVTRLKINLANSKLVPVGDVVDVEGLASIFGCRVASLPMKYLGLLTGASYKATSIWNDIIEKMEWWLAGWKRLKLSKEGRLILIKHSFQFAYLLFVPLPYFCKHDK